MTEPRNDPLFDAARQLDRDISPARDLWPGIAHAIATPQRFTDRSQWAPMLAQAAAVVLLVGASSAITYISMKGQPPVTEITPELLFEQTAFSSADPLGAGFEDARTTLAVEFDEALLQLPPDARADVERNLGIVRTAIHEINTALSQDPGNAALQAKLLGAYHEEVSVLRRVGELSRNVMMRNDI